MAQAEQTGRTGKQLLSISFNKMDSDLQDVSAGRWKAFFTGKPFGTKEELYREIGLGKISSDLAAYELLGTRESKKGGSRRKAPSIPIGGGLSGATKQADCCHPLPNEPVIGILRKGSGKILVHLHTCPELQDLKGSAQWIDVAWDSNATASRYLAPIVVDCLNKPGVTSRVFTIIAENEVNIEGFSMQGGGIEHKQVCMHIKVEVHSARQCEELIDKLRADPVVYEAKRARKQAA